MSILDRVRDWRLPAGERQAARQERLAERTLRRERDNEHRAEQRGAALEAEARRQSNSFGPGGDGGGGSVFGGSG